MDFKKWNLISTCMPTSTLLCIIWHLIFDIPSGAWHNRAKKNVKTYFLLDRIIEHFVHPKPPHNINPSRWKNMIITDFSKSNFDRQWPTWKKTDKIDGDPSFLIQFWIPKNYLGENYFERRSLTWKVEELSAFIILRTWCWS